MIPYAFVADAASVRSFAAPVAKATTPLRHTALVRITHWITTGAFGVLLLSGIAILLAHPRLYWGETGGVGGPSLIDLPVPFVLDTTLSEGTIDVP